MIIFFINSFNLRRKLQLNMLFLSKNIQALRGLKLNETSRVLLYTLPSRSRSTFNEYDYMQQSSLPTMHFQASLPHLPIPKLEDTCRRYLNAQQPILSRDEYKITATNVAAFQSMDGPQLNKRLLEIDEINKHTSYISEPWFDMYLRDRKPLPINYNPFLVFIQENDTAYNKQIVKATNLIISSARFMNSLRLGILEPEVYHMNPKKSDTKFFRTFTGILPSRIATYGAYLFKAFPLDMSQFNHLFGTTRIPELEKDRIQNDPNSKHVVVMRKGHFYSFNVLNDDGSIRSPKEIASCINSILNDPRKQNDCPIGILTAIERDNWAKIRQHLLKIGNDEVLKKIDSATFVLILDDDSFHSENHNKLIRHFLHSDGTNRWFDKSFSLIVTGDGHAGINFEHSWGDGVAVLRYFRNIKGDIEKNPKFHPGNIDELSSSQSDVEKLEFTIDDSIRETVNRSIKDYEDWTNNKLTVDHMIFNEFGKNKCKTFGVSPDSVMQLAFQLALYKRDKCAVATYESCSTSAFKHGRTETIRSCTNKTKALCEAIVESGSSSINDNEFKRLMIECSKVHNLLTKEAAMGQGFDRHLFSLKRLCEMTEGDDKIPDIFKDPAYRKINHNILSTSTLSSPEVLAGGFGPVVDDGYGIGYMIQDNRLGSVITSYKKHRDAVEYVTYLKSAFDDLHRILRSK